MQKKKSNSAGLYACENLILTTELERRPKVFRCVLNISYKDHVINEEPQQDPGFSRSAWRFPSHDAESQMVWLQCKIVLHDEDNSAEISERG